MKTLEAQLFGFYMDKLNEIFSKDTHIKPGSIARSDPPQVNSNGETVLPKEEVKRLADYINQGYDHGITCTINTDRLKDCLNKMKLRIRLSRIYKLIND